jgi:hypothetical protein
VAGFCEHSNEPSGSIKKVGYSLMSSLTINFFKEYPAPWSKQGRKEGKDTEKYYFSDVGHCYGFGGYGEGDKTVQGYHYLLANCN